MRKPLLAVLLTIAVVLPSCGCLDIHLAKELFIPERTSTVEYHFRYYNISHTFVTVYNDLTTLEFENVTIVPAYNDSVYLDVVADVTIQPIPALGENLPLPINISDVDRYCIVEVYHPNGTVVMERTFNITTSQPFQFPRVKDPAVGEWKVRVKAAGIGNPAIDYNDAFKVEVKVYEPVGAE